MTRHNNLALSPEEIKSLNHIFATGNTPASRLAQIILLTDAGLDASAVAAEMGLEQDRVVHWQDAFRSERMGIFQGAGLPPAPTEEAPPPPPDLSSGAPPVPGSPLENARPEIPPPSQAPAPSASRPGVDTPRLELALATSPGLQPPDPMSEAGRKILLFHFERMLHHEPGSRLGEDIEAVHDMRVATRRMRSAFTIFRAYYRKKPLEPIDRGLRRTARMLGAVRDMDVFLEKLNRYQKTLPANSGSIAPLIAVCEAQRDQDRAALIDYLNSRAFGSFVSVFDKFLKTPGAGARKRDATSPLAYQVRHIAPRIIYERYEAVHAYETVLDHASIETLHALRIDCKRLRYTLEFFVEVLGEEIGPVITELKALQDHLGDLNDAEVAGNFLRDFINNYERETAGVLISERQNIEPVVQYMAFQFAEKHRLTTTFGDSWARFNRYELRRNLALAIAAL